MKSGGPRKSLKRYQLEGEVMESAPTPAPTPAPSKSYADIYKANLAAGLPEGKSRKYALIEAGLKEPKKRLDANIVLDTFGKVVDAGNTAVKTFSNKGNNSGGMTESPGFNRKGGVSKFVSKKPAMKKGGVTRKVMVKSKKK